MVGNDIVDIDETKRTTNWERPGFLNKVCTTKERSMIAASPDPFKTVWRLWGMKESAYKVFIQAGGTRFFDPTKIECSFDSLENGQAEIGTAVFKTITSIDANYIFSTATVDQSRVDTCIIKLVEINLRQQSEIIHEQLLNYFAKNNALDPTELLLVKTPVGVPTLHYKRQAINTSISITHHGKYGAYSIVANKVPFIG